MVRRSEAVNLTRSCRRPTINTMQRQALSSELKTERQVVPCGGRKMGKRDKAWWERLGGTFQG